MLINVWEGTDAANEARRYCTMWDIDATVLLDETASYAHSIGVRGVPTNILVDRRGVVRAVGIATKSSLERALREATADA